MENLELKKLWQVMNTLSEKQSELAEESVYVYLMGDRSNYGDMSFEGFLNYYSFRIDGDEIIVFNNDPVSWEDYSTDDFSYIPLSLISFGEEQLENWMQNEIEKQLAQQKLIKLAEKENLKSQIKRLETQLNNL